MKSVVPSGRHCPSVYKVAISPLPTGPSVDVPWLRHWRKNVENITHVDLSALKSDTLVNDMIEKHVPGSLLAKVSKAIDEMMAKSYKTATEIAAMASNPGMSGVGRQISPEQYRDFDPLGREAPRRPLSQQITVADVCELAKAGVKMDVNDVAKLLEAPSVYTNPPQVAGPDPYSMTLEDRIAHRWQSTTIMSSDSNLLDGTGRQFRSRNPSGFDVMPFKIGKVITHGDKQYVFVHKEGNAPLIIEDDCAQFPSDCLMNALRLMDKALPDAAQGNMSGGVAGGGMGETSAPTTGTGINQRFQAAQNAQRAQQAQAVVRTK